MSEQWRIFVVVDDENLNRNIVSSLRKDGYIVNGAIHGREAVRTLWAEVHDIVISDLHTPGADGFELLQWLRAYRPNTQVILIGNPVASLRTQALEAGAIGYLEKPLDLHLLKEELRRLLVQTGFSADLDSFDLLDVIQIISGSRKNIALLVNTGLEERGMLCFHQGNLVWAEYGMLRGEEAFFALAAHKNGTVIHQPWNQQVTPNVKQPLSRLILQAFQYRTKYNQIQQQLSGEHNVLPPSPTTEEDEDAPFLVLTEHITEEPQEAFPVRTDAFASMTSAVPVAEVQGRDGVQGGSKGEKEWWEQTGKFAGSGVRSSATSVPVTPLIDTRLSEDEEVVPLATHSHTTNDLENNKESTSDVEQEPGKRNDLPSWLTDQPTASNMPVIRDAPPTIPTRNFRPSSPATPVVPPPSEWQPTRPPLRTPRKLVEQRVKETTGPQNSVKTDTVARKGASSEWQPPDGDDQRQSGPLPSFDESDVTLPLSRRQITNGDSLNGASSTGLRAMPANSDRAKRNYNYTALVSALQTLGYSISGFVAAAVVGMDGQPIAQVAVDDLDISPMCKHLSTMMKSTFQALDEGAWGEYEQLVITSAERYVLIRAIGDSRKAFQVLVTTRTAKPTDSGSIMANVEGAIAAALG